MEAFSGVLKRAVSGGFLPAWHARGKGRKGLQISHLLFADVLCDAFEDQMTYLTWLLMWYVAISSMSVNLDKSELIKFRNFFEHVKSAAPLEKHLIGGSPKIKNMQGTQI